MKYLFLNTILILNFLYLSIDVIQNIMKKILLLLLLCGSLSLNAQIKNQKTKLNRKVTVVEKKKVVYQVFTRLFGNTNTTNKP